MKIHRGRSAWVLLMLVAGLGLTGCGAGADGMSQGQNIEETPPAPATTSPVSVSVPNQVVIDNFTFRPAKLTVTAGTKVTWINRDDVPHTATSTVKPRLFNSGTLDTDDQFTHVFTTPGTYEYFCAVHPHMTAQLIVK
jgi:plastocyanin